MAHVKQVKGSTGNKGSDTSQVVITSTLFYCLHSADTLVLLQAEVRAALDDVEDICIGARLEFCYYLRACIDESMRLSPPLGAIMPRQALLRGLHVDGNFFPAGTEIWRPRSMLFITKSIFILMRSPSSLPADA